MRLAREIVGIFHSPAAAEAAQARWDEVFRGGAGVPDDMDEAELGSHVKKSAIFCCG